MSVEATLSRDEATNLGKHESPVDHVDSPKV